MLNFKITDNEIRYAIYHYYFTLSDDLLLISDLAINLNFIFEKKFGYRILTSLKLPVQKAHYNTRLTRDLLYSRNFFQGDERNESIKHTITVFLPINDQDESYRWQPNEKECVRGIHLYLLAYPANDFLGIVHRNPFMIFFYDKVHITWLNIQFQYFLYRINLQLINFKVG